ncbi:hypothetical protein HPB50_010340 [Hyalomma asiaticum]|uniref:Uncharacterized protein n=1 Tax=Hyalomma asiaticum TaxID=266040 RepID=A0ACB7T0A8_HYAAI|nr:hypothetical protein HPB50_010340 [Hyalomma asiaticum]
MPPSDLQQTITDAVREVNAELRSRLDDFEDRSRRENLIFFGIPDAAAETWSQSEDKVREIVSTLGVQLPTDGISRAHRLGSYANKKCRPGREVGGQLGGPAYSGDVLPPREASDPKLGGYRGTPRN